MKWSQYKPYLDKARKIYLALYGEPKDKHEIADSFNKIGMIARILIQE